MLFGTNSLDDRVREILVETLYSQPSSLAIAALTGILASLVAAQQTNQPQITNLAIIVSLIAYARIIMAYFLPRLIGRDSRKLESLYEADEILAIVGAESNGNIECSLSYFNVYGTDGSVLKLRYDLGD